MAEVVPFERFERTRLRRLERDDNEPRLSTAELCEFLKVSPSTIKRYRKAGMPFEPWSSRTYRYRLSLVLRWREEQAA